MKKLLNGLVLPVVVGLMVFGLNTNVSALQLVFDKKEVGNLFSWNYSQLIEYLENEGFEGIGNILTEEAWNNYQEPELQGPEDGSTGDRFPDLSSSSVAIIKSGTLIGIFTGDDIPQDWDQLPDGMNSVSSIAVPEPGFVFSLGLILIIFAMVSRKRLNTRKS